MRIDGGKRLLDPLYINEDDDFMQEVKSADKTRNFFIYHLPAISYAAAIIIVSSIPDISAPRLKFLAADKLAHFVEYGLFAYLSYRSIRHLAGPTGIRPLLISGLLVTLFAVLDEYYQSFIPGRTSDIYDFLVDFLAAALVLFLLYPKCKTASGN